MTPEVACPKDGPLQAVIDKYDRGTPSQAKVDEYMGKAGYAKNADGKWAKDGTVLKVPVYGPSFFGPLGAAAHPDAERRRLRRRPAAGREVRRQRSLPGNADTLVPGPLRQPERAVRHAQGPPQQELPPDRHSRSRTSSPGRGTSNPEMDTILDKMDAIQADPDPDPST